MAKNTADAKPEAAKNQYNVSCFVTVQDKDGNDRSKKVATFTTPEGDSATAVGAVLQVLGELTEAQRADITRVDIKMVDPNKEVSFRFPDAESDA